MIKGIKVMLIPNNKQKTMMFKYSNAKRFAYNWTLSKQIENFRLGNKFISDNDLRKEFTQLKKLEEFKWLNNISNNVTKQAIKDCCIAYKNFFDKQKRQGYVKYTKEILQKCAKQKRKPSIYDMNGHPKFKSKKHDIPKFYQDNVQIRFSGNHVKFEGFAESKKKNKQQLNWVRLAEKNRIPFGKDIKYINPRCSFDGLNWWISVGIEIIDNYELPVNDGLGIDLGIKDLAICSDGNTYKNINKTKDVRRLKKKQHRLQRKVSRKYLINKEEDSYKKTCNIIKLENQLLKVSRRLKNIRHNYLHQTTTKIINRKPMFIVMEDLNVLGMMKNKHLSKAIQEQCFYEFYRQINYKSLWNNIKFIEANRYFASSKICSDCGAKNTKLKLSDREWICEECGTTHDRDFNASINLRNYGQSIA